MNPVLMGILRFVTSAVIVVLSVWLVHAKGSMTKTLRYITSERNLGGVGTLAIDGRLTCASGSS